MKMMFFPLSIKPLRLAAGLLLALVPASFAQVAVSNSIPLVTLQPIDSQADWAGDPGTISVLRTGNPAPALNVYLCLSGTASNGVDYQTLGNFVPLPAGVMSNAVVIQPINHGQTDIRTVTLTLCPSPLMTPVNYAIGQPASATIYITPPGATNLPPAVSIISPTNGAVFYAPVNLTLLARASAPAGTITSVEFFAGTNDLGPGLPVVLDPPGVAGVVGLVYLLNWPDVPPNRYALTAVAADNAGSSTISAPVHITVLANPPPTNLPPVVRITSPPNGAVFRAPVNLPLFAFAADPDDGVATVEFFAGTSSLGFGHPVTAVPPPLPPGPIQPPILIVVPTNYWELVWSNAPPGTNIALTARATDSGGAITLSSPVTIGILPALPPPTNRTPIITIVATDPIAIEGTNCWPWLGLASAVPNWSNWLAPSAVCRLYTNCGPKNATFTVFRSGATNDDLNVTYGIGGTATNGLDYVALSGVATILAGQQRAAISVVPLDDGTPDLNSTVILKLTPATDYVLGFPQTAAAVIFDSRSPLPRTRMLPGSCFNLSAIGPDGAWFRVEFSTDLVNWTPVCTNQVVNGGIDFVDPDAHSATARFYRTLPEAAPPSQ